ncbi:histidine kinase [Fibrella aquatilis]|uniref:Histidine kinase n=1 Tax=Fibrella aquatilis TaxID=2817059 RepID=A0A939G6Z4_9BACT|nr:histidine kinase [Fibrella aquatilis]MBO0931307.1 histidine kinase [Fibrella aquatilis]
MIRQLRTLQERIPLSVRQFWHRYGVFVILGVSLIGYWLGDGERYINAYLESTPKMDQYTQNRLKSSGYKFGYTLAYIVVRFVYAPEQAFPWLGLAWSLAVINYRYMLKRFVFRGNWLSRAGYGLFAFTIMAGALANAITLTTGPNGVNATIAWWLLAWFMLYGIWAYFRDINKTRRALTETGTQAELTALKAQVNPHFLFNSLNNIFGTALTEGGHRTPDGVQQLSRLIRYQLEQTQTQRVDVADELRFVDEYVQFHRQLLAREQTVSFSYDWDEQPALLPPLLLTPLIDHALQQAGDTTVTGTLSVRQQRLHLQLTYPANSPNPDSEAIENVRQRLRFLYPDQHTLNQQVVNRVATAELHIDLTS